MLKIALVNGSPKAANSNSEHIIEEIKYELDDIQIEEFRMDSKIAEHLDRIVKCNVLVLVLPLYIDGIPSHFLNCMMQMERYFWKEQAGMTVYAVVQGGFFEGIQTKTALEMLENWCARCNLKWGQSVGVGGGGMLASLDQKHNYFMQNIEEAVGELCDNIRETQNGPSLYAEPNLPRSAYKLGAERQWRKELKANGLKKDDIDRKPGMEL